MAPHPVTRLSFGSVVLAAAALSAACATSRSRAPDPTPAPRDSTPSNSDAAPPAPGPAPITHSNATTDASTDAIANPIATADSSAAPPGAWSEFQPGVRARELRCNIRVPGQTTLRPMTFTQVRVSRGSAYSLEMIANPSAGVPDARCTRGYDGGSPSSFLELLRSHDTDAVAAVNGSLFFRARVDAPLAWWPEGLVWTVHTPPGIPPSEPPLRFNECRSDRASIAVIDDDGLHELRVGLEPCPAGTPLVPPVPEMRRQWCGPPAGPPLWGYEHREACARVDTAAVASLSDTAREAMLRGARANGLLLRTADLVQRVRSAMPTARTMFQITGPWPSFNEGTLEPNGALTNSDAVCNGDTLADPRRMPAPTIHGIHTAICRPLPRTFVCGHAGGDVSIVTTRAASIEDIARATRAASGCELECERAFNLDGGGSTQIAWRDASAVRGEWGIPQAAPCGPFRDPANYLTVVHR